MIEFEHGRVELAGMNLIEASAGTGKTYAIACLYLRLLIEQILMPEQILVVTYTEAATKELRGRIRDRIRETLDVLQGAPAKDTFISGLCENITRQTDSGNAARRTLERALATFDTASIFTIHGFCQRALQENAFESGSCYDTELVTDQGGLLQEIVDDFWRRRFFSSSAPLLGYSLRRKFSPESWLKFLGALLVSSRLQVIPHYTESEIAECEADCRLLFGDLQKEWTASCVQIAEIIATDTGLRRSEKTYRTDLLPTLIEGMDSFVGGDNPFDLFDGFEKLCSSFMDANKFDSKPPPQHPFFVRCEKLRDLVEQRMLMLKWELLAFAREQLPLRKQQTNIRFFDDLLVDLHRALIGDTGTSLAAALRGRYRAALIDEFQDTDPLQYDIFRKIYGGSTNPLFLIGDPKQAIYSFRGADIFAYMEAARDVSKQNRFTLTGNWRSTPRLLDAFNTVFASSSRPFVYDEIAYHPVTAGSEDAAGRLLFAGAEGPPFHIWHIPSDGVTAVNVTRANELIPSAVAAEISRLLQDGRQGKTQIDGRAVTAGDMAVIVRSHRQAALIQQALRESGIPSVTHGSVSLFSTGEAQDVATMLRALAEPGNESKVRAALISDILGRSARDIMLLLDDETAWDACLERFRRFHHTWSTHGFMIMAHELMADESVRERLLRFEDGERRLTNLLHCFEIIHQREHEQGTGIEGLVTWFGERLLSGDTEEEHQIRLETDEMAVKVVTVHVSKGLEYPIVFCPFLWNGIKGNEEILSFHRGSDMVKDFGSPDFDSNRDPAECEALAESLRLLYVALTRAKYRCYLIGGKITSGSKPQISPLAYLFHTAPDTKTSHVGLTSRMRAEIIGLSPLKIVEQLEEVQFQSGGSIAVSQLPDGCDIHHSRPFAEDHKDFTCRTFSGVVETEWRVASFTSFTAHESVAVELPDRDNTGVTSGSETTQPDMTPGKNIFRFPRGSEAGIFMHEIFEKLDFTNSSPAVISTLTETCLDKYGYEPEWLPHIVDMVTAVVTTPLATAGDSFTLADIGKGKWRAEMEFFFPLKFITSELLCAVLKKWGHDCQAFDFGTIASALNFRPVRGMVRGFMDMVFEHGGRYYLLDWKSNHLGYRIEDYRQEALTGAMTQHLYPLQYLLYTVALNRYLMLRVRGYDYATHFGGVIYVFLRGVSPRYGEEYGFFRDIPPVGIIAELTESLVQLGANGGGCDDI
ncbi:MAG: exodeoxyribonuclease V subunit beta [Desulfuromonadales bacterium]